MAFAAQIAHRLEQSEAPGWGLCYFCRVPHKRGLAGVKYGTVPKIPSSTRELVPNLIWGARLRSRFVMLAFIDEGSDTAFQPEEVRILTAAFDKAWDAVQASGAKFDTKRVLEAARAVIAKHIIEAAKQGERDQGRLRDGALKRFPLIWKHSP